MPPAKRRPNAHPAGQPQSKSARPNNAASSQSSSQLIDLTAPPSSLGHANRLPPRSEWAVIDDDEGFPDPSQSNEDPSSSYELYGTLDNKIVGIRYYNGVVNPGEKVLLRREPGNPYDKNAIRVDNAMRNQIGHIPATLAAKLAPYIDSEDIILDGVLTGHKETFTCPVRLFFYGTSDPRNRLLLEEKLKADKLLKATQLKATRKEAEAQRNAAMRLRCNASTVGLGTEEEEQEREQSLQELAAGSEAVQFRGDLRSVDVFSVDEDALSKLPKADQPATIKSTLLPYQLQGLAWMIAKENPQLPATGSKEVVQLWKRHSSGNFLNLVSNHITNTPPQLVSGGVLADDMGLGKTLQVISLIMSSGFSDGPTLIVAPVSVMSNWEQQFERHVQEDQRPRIFRYYKAGTYSKDEVLKHDVVITTYDKLRNDKSNKGILFSIEWRRVVLDEAHAIRNFSTSRAKAAFELKAKSRWMLTGTPIVNSPKDFLSALKFLRMTGGIEETTFFVNMIDKPLSSGTEGGENEFKLAKQLFQSLTRDLCLRRRKNMKFVDLKLPAKTEYIHRIKFRNDEKQRYDALLSETTKALEAYQQERGGQNNRQGPQIRFTSVLEKLLRLRQLCCHWTLCGGRVKDVLRPLENKKIVDFTPENLKILQQALLAANNEGEECPICTDAISIHDPIITACKHRFGRPCIARALERDKRCPMCRQSLSLEAIVGLEPVNTDNHFDGDTRSSKTEALEKILKARLEDPESKVVVFSQWTSFLEIIAKLLDDAGYKYCRLEGWMTATRRDQSIDALNNDPDTRIMLASLAASGVGLNLVAADTVILVDSWWAPAIEDQAIDRVHRLGQTRETTVWKLVMDDSVEERVLNIQARKRELVSLAFQDKAREQKDTGRLDDVRQLLS
ncbi:SNF2 family N-terminal domain-containing protein [Daldinia caldariorum]|uniref:SNF2 family N-terminal domain-containing protein n=1 Tax=Daldinia caldariorum TaxID=326644 RepID=UPI002008B0A9|nr:SNF2 family N-terminal domain-containing protein [Daldinia caldariorum]KAI1470954.1 SNF2 family N-terminal domain-containing protein [Daldinia caldariorum]